MKVKKLNLQQAAEKFSFFSKEQAIMIKGGNGDKKDNEDDADDDDVEILN